MFEYETFLNNMLFNADLDLCATKNGFKSKRESITIEDLNE